jgi:hypothetical protein
MTREGFAMMGGADKGPASGQARGLGATARDNRGLQHPKHDASVGMPAARAA